MNILYTSIQFFDQSSGNIDNWFWDFGDNTFQYSQPNPTHTYKDSIGIVEVKLVVIDDVGCRDTTIKQLWIENEFWIYIPNSFTPNNDGINDNFCLSYNGILIETFYFNIFDRYSNLVYATNNINDLKCLSNNGWDGLNFKTGNELPMGTYIYEIYFQDFEGWKHKEVGHLQLIR
jgi:gliding motility-associated-like protein